MRDGCYLIWSGRLLYASIPLTSYVWSFLIYIQFQSSVSMIGTSYFNYISSGFNAVENNDSIRYLHWHRWTREITTHVALRVNVRQFRIKTRWHITSVSFALTYHFPDLYQIHENSGETLGPKYSIVNLLKNIKIWSFLCQYHSLAQRWRLLLKSHSFGIIRKLDVNQYIFSYTSNQTSAMTYLVGHYFSRGLSLHWKIELCAWSGALLWLLADLLWLLYLYSLAFPTVFSSNYVLYILFLPMFFLQVSCIHFVRWPMLAAQWLFTSRCFVPNLVVFLLGCFKSISILHC